MDLETLAEIVRSKPELDDIPVVANASFGHTTPAFTFPIGGSGALRAHAGDVGLRIETH
jgi:muramoyltetrapeptide carboxypeptidase LdcA involved in peptidoglycan recycling